MSAAIPAAPLENLEDWEQFLEGRYHEGKSEEEFRQYDADANPGVAEFYRINHQMQTVDYVLAKEKQYFGLQRGTKTVWEAAEYLNTLVDDSDPDTDLTQIEHLLQTSEAIRRDGHPRWMVLVGFIHDLGKCLCLYGEPQWGVVGDTFPVGCAWSDQIVFPRDFEANPDRLVPQYQTKYGIYEPGCGLENLHLSFGHDGYIAEVMKPYLPDEALYMLRFHSFLPPGTAATPTSTSRTRKTSPCSNGSASSTPTTSTQKAMKSRTCSSSSPFTTTCSPSSSRPSWPGSRHHRSPSRDLAE